MRLWGGISRHGNAWASTSRYWSKRSGGRTFGYSPFDILRVVLILIYLRSLMQVLHGLGDIESASSDRIGYVVFSQLSLDYLRVYFQYA